MTENSSKILIADDSHSVHRLIRSCIPTEYSTHIVSAFDGVECLKALDSGVDLAFIDIHMPKMGGLDALCAARISGNKTFVTLISGRNTKHCIDLAHKLDAYEFLIKPFSRNEIETIVRNFQRISNPMKVLLVEDSPIIIKIMHKVLANSIFRLNIEEARTGRVAVGRCSAEAFDVVFLDASVRGSNGYETLARLRQAHPATKIVVISADRNVLSESEALNRGATAVIYKPFFPTEIDDVLHRIFGLKSPKLTTEDRIRGFDIRLHGRTIAVEHSDSGHVYEYVWFRDPPYLRLPLVRENEMANIPAHRLMPTAKKVAVLELERASLLDNSVRQ